MKSDNTSRKLCLKTSDKNKIETLHIKALAQDRYIIKFRYRSPLERVMRFIKN